MNSLLRPFLTCPFHQTVLGTTVFALTGTYLLLRAPHLPLPSTIASPRTTLDTLTPEEIAKLPYPPDLYPGGRWVNTPYGVIRVYEWGPEDGRKVLFVHGIGTPSCGSRDLMWELVEQEGCRVMIFDLYGRGWSDTPVLTPHDHRLYASQIIFAIPSSPLHWSSFSLIGYSFGGGVSVAFAAIFPSMVDALILLAPCGIVKSARLGLFARLANAGYVPASIAGWFARHRTHGKPSAEVAAARELKADAKDRSVVVDIEGVVDWQGKCHEGFLSAFLGSFRNGPVFDREAEWAEVGKEWRREGKRALVVVGGEDVVVEPGLLGEMVELLSGGEEGGKRVVGHVMEGLGHDFVVRRGRELAVDVIGAFWRDGGE